MESNEYLNFAEEMSLTQIGNNMTRDIRNILMTIKKDKAR